MLIHKVKILTAIIFSLAVFASFAQAQVCSPPPSGMAAWLPGDNHSNDISGNNHHGSLQNGATFAPGMVAQGFSFDGMDDFVQVSHHPDLQPTQGLTVDAWVKFNSFYTGNCLANYVVSKGFSDGAESTPGAYQLVVVDQAVIDTNDCLTPASGVKKALFTLGFGGILHSLAGTTQIQLGTYYHLTATYDGSVMKLYVNGVLENSKAVNLPLGSNNDPLTIGQFLFPGSPYNFNGIVDEVEVLNRALSDTEVAAIFNAGSAGKCKPVVTSASVSVSGRVLSPRGKGVVRALVVMTDMNGSLRTAVTNHFGFYRFEEVETGRTYMFDVFSKKYQFDPQVMTINEEMENLNFHAIP